MPGCCSADFISHGSGAETYKGGLFMMPPLGMQHFYVKNGGPKKVINYAELRHLEI